MEQVTVTRTVEARPDAVAELMADRAAFMRAAGFDRVEYNGEYMTIENRVGLFDIELVLEIVDADAAFAYEQREGVFESMYTEYRVDGQNGATTVTATTEYEALDLEVVGRLLDATVVHRQRKRELNTQFDWLASQLS